MHLRAALVASLLLACSPDAGGASDTQNLSSGTDTSDSPACGEAPPFTGFMAQTIEVAGQARTYGLTVPADYDPNHAYPLVFAWHGLGGSGAVARIYFKIEEAAAGQAIVVYPDALPLPELGGQTGWDLGADGRDVALFDAILADVSTRLCVDESRVFSAGHSFGGAISNTLGCVRGDTLRAIAPVAGGGPFGTCTGPVAAWIAHGTVDVTVPLAMGSASRDHWLAANNCSSTSAPTDPAPCVAYDDCDAGYPVHWCQHDELELGGHGWPAWAGPAIWRFFAAL